jgi:hypothetical protein
MPLVVVPLVVTVQDEPLTVRVEVNPATMTVPSIWQRQEELPESSMDEQHTCPPPPPPLLLLLHAATRPTNTTVHADVIGFIEEDPLSDRPSSISSVAEPLQGASTQAVARVFP